MKYENNKFLVINRKFLLKIPIEANNYLIKAFELMEPYLPKHKYYVVNQDEPYAKKVFKVIEKGEDKKLNKSRMGKTNK